MRITTQGKGIKIGKNLEQKILDKMSKFDKYFGEEGTFNVCIKSEGNHMASEITMKLNGKYFRAEAKDEEVLNAVDKTIDKLESQIRKQKTKIMNKRKDYPQVVSYLEADSSADYDFEVEEEKKIVKRKNFELRPMTSEDAILQMEMLGHSFLVYLDQDTETVCVIYKRKDGNYGLIEPEY